MSNGGPGHAEPLGAGHDDPESADASTVVEDRLDVTPRTGVESGPASGRGGRTRTYVAVGCVAAIVVGLGVVLFNGLQGASTFFYNVDEVVAKQPSLQGERIRVQGNVVDGTVHKTAEGVSFVLRFDGKELAVDHVGDPPELFGPKIPVVLEGSLKGDTFHSDQILIRHDANYDEKNKGRVADAKTDAEQGAVGAGSAGSIGADTNATATSTVAANGTGSGGVGADGVAGATGGTTSQGGATG